MQEYSETAWNIASQYSHVLASETRDLAAWIDKAVADERERCAKIARDPLLWQGQRDEDVPFPANAMHREAGEAIALAITRKE